MQVQESDEKMCMMRGCTEIDMLPATCVECKKLFCSRHIGYADHQCKNHKKNDHVAPICPLCNKPVPIKTGESADFAVSKHIDAGCRTVDSSQSQNFETTRSGHKGKERHNFCSFSDCTRNEIQLIICGRCNQSFCIDHRAPSAHKCAKATPPPQVSARTTSPEATKTHATAKDARALPLAKRKFQNTPKNAIPCGGVGEHPVVFGLYFPKDSRIEPAYFSAPPTFSVGRLIDFVGKHVDLPNRNNTALPEEERIHLHNLNRNMLLPANLNISDAFGGENAYTDLGIQPMAMLTRGPQLPPEVEAEVAELQEAAAKKQASKTPTAKKEKGDCQMM